MVMKEYHGPAPLPGSPPGPGPPPLPGPRPLTAAAIAGRDGRRS